jgi:hypothetical protein
MWYKFENETWKVAVDSVAFPDGSELKDDLTEERDGWKFYETEPIEYTEWIIANTPSNLP